MPPDSAVPEAMREPCSRSSPRPSTSPPAGRRSTSGLYWPSACTQATRVAPAATGRRQAVLHGGAVAAVGRPPQQLQARLGRRQAGGHLAAVSSRLPSSTTIMPPELGRGRAQQPLDHPRQVAGGVVGRDDDGGGHHRAAAVSPRRRAGARLGRQLAATRSL